MTLPIFSDIDNDGALDIIYGEETRNGLYVKILNKISNPEYSQQLC